MQDELLQKYNALSGNIRQIAEEKGKGRLIQQLAREHSIPLSGLLMQLLVGNATPAVFRAAIAKLVPDRKRQKNLLYVLEENFLEPYEKIRSPKAEIEPLDHSDHAGIRTLKARQAAAGPKKFYDLGRMADVVAQNYFSKDDSRAKDILEDGVMKKRLKNVLVSYLKDIRDRLETRHALMRSQKVGGMGFRDKEADRMISLLEGEKKNMASYVKEVVFEEEKKFVPPAPAAQREKPSIAPQPATRPARKLPAWPVAKPPTKRLAPPPPVLVQPKQSARPLPPKKKDSAPAPQQIRVRTVEARPKATPQRASVGVPVSPRLVGPVEELRQMTLVDFRRLSSDPKEAAGKVGEKIDLLGQESLQRRAQGERAWEESESYRQYLALGQASMQKGLPVAQVISQRLESGQETLTKGEFDAIMDLNKRLRS